MRTAERSFYNAARKRLHKFFTGGDEEGAPQPAQLMADEGDPADQQEAPSQSCSQAQDDQQGPEPPKHCEGRKMRGFLKKGNQTFVILSQFYTCGQCVCVCVWGVVGTCCSIITGMGHRSKCDRKREQVTMDTDLGFWLVC